MLRVKSQPKSICKSCPLFIKNLVINLLCSCCYILTLFLARHPPCLEEVPGQADSWTLALNSQVYRHLKRIASNTSNGNMYWLVVIGCVEVNFETFYHFKINVVVCISTNTIIIILISDLFPYGLPKQTLEQFKFFERLH